MLADTRKQGVASPIRRKARAPASVPTLVRGRATAKDRVATVQQSRYATIGLVLIVALLAFEVFNFDTTRYALGNLLGDVTFVGLRWATILAIAFCGIDFAGLLRVFTPDVDGDNTSEMWYLMVAWLLGATMNAAMTWWAVSLALLNHDIGNEVIGREQLLVVVPIFVAVLVWLTRILFIGALSIAGGRLFAGMAGEQPTVPKRKPAPPFTMPRPSMAVEREPLPQIPLVEAEPVNEPAVMRPAPVAEDETIFVPPSHNRSTTRQHVR